MVAAKLSCIIQRYVTQALPFLWPIESVSKKEMIREGAGVHCTKLYTTDFLEIVKHLEE